MSIATNLGHIYVLGLHDIGNRIYITYCDIHYDIKKYRNVHQMTSIALFGKN